MKTKLLLLFFLGSFISVAQLPIWPTSNAEWYYSYGDQMTIDGYTHYKIERDTVIASRTYQIYSRQYEVLFSGLPEPVLWSGYQDKYFIIGVEDSVVLYYDEPTEEIDTLMNFKSEGGQKWFNYNRKDFEFCTQETDYLVTTVDTKSIEIVNGHDLLLFGLSREVEGETIYYGQYDWYYQLMGSDYNFAPIYFCANMDASTEYHLRCFNYHLGESDEFTYKNWLGDCDYVEGLGLKGLASDDLKVVTQRNQIRISGTELKSSGDLRICNTMGAMLPFKIIHQNDAEWLLELEQKHQDQFVIMQLMHNEEIYTFKLMLY